MNDPNLHELTEQLNVKIALCENLLASLGLGVVAEVPFGETLKVLAWMKCSGGWGLYVIEGEDKRDPLSSCSRETRLQAIPALASMKESLLEMYEIEKNRVKGALEEMDSIIQVLEVGYERKP